MSYPHRFYAIVTPGLEKIAAKELEQLSAHEIKPDNGGVHFSGTMETMFRVNLRSRVVTRILMRLKKFTALSLNDLSHAVEQVDWKQFLDHSLVSIHASCHTSKLMHTAKIENTIRDAINKSGLSVESEGMEQQLFIRIENNRCLLSIDTSGERLDRRGYRLEGGKAPLRETLAAAILQWMDWKPDEPLLIPMCGSGTFAIEAAILANRLAPGLTHQFPFLNWPQLKQKGWERILERTQSMQVTNLDSLQIRASDINPDAIEITRRNAARAGVEQFIHLEQKDARELLPTESSGAGLIVCNPPYGHRIDTNVGALYAALGSTFKSSFHGWRMAVISPDQKYEKQLGLPVKRRIKVKHGGKWVYILHV
jgi:putative N6-adenine-specific DNA methylase